MAWYETPKGPPGMRHDGEYINLLNRYGTIQDNSTAYQFRGSGIVPDMYLTDHYEGNGLFAKIIDAPAEEAIKHGFDLGLQGCDTETYITEMLDSLDFDDVATNGIRWSRLYGGALGVMLIDDGRGLEEPLDYKSIKSIEEIRVYERAVVWPDYSVMYNFDPTLPWKGTTTKYGMPERYFINSIFGQFWVHESRCLIFRNGVLPERTMQPYYRFWGTPEYLRIKRELRETITSHSTAVKMLERSVLPVFAMEGLSEMLASEDGKQTVLERIKAIDTGRNLLNSVVIDGGGSGGGNESYDFKSFPMSGVKDIVDTSCNILSAVTNIPQTILFGRSPTGMNATGKGDLEGWYNYIERIQKLMLKKNLRVLIDIIVRAGMAQGEIAEKPKVKIKFSPLWSMDETEEADVDQKKATTQKIRAETGKIYFDMGAVDETEIRKKLAKEGEFDIEDLLESIGASPEMPDMMGGEGIPAGNQAPFPPEDIALDSADNPGTVGIIVMKDGKILAGIRSDNGEMCGPGGHMEPGELPLEAAIRESEEEFGITLKNAKLLGRLKGLDRQYGEPFVYLCTEFDGVPRCEDGEMEQVMWINPKRHHRGHNMFPPFDASIRLLNSMK